MTQHQQTGILTPGISICEIRINASLRFAWRKAYLHVQSFINSSCKMEPEWRLRQQKVSQNALNSPGAKHRTLPPERTEKCSHQSQAAYEYCFLPSHSTVDGHT